MFAPLILAFYLLVPFAMAVVRIARGRAHQGSYAVAAFIAFALIFTLTRSALVGALAVGAAGVGMATAGSNRVRFAMVAMLGLLVLGPFGADAGLSARNSETFDEGAAGADVSHPEALRAGFDDLVGHPLGTGPGTARYGGDQAYLQLGNELGLLGLVLFVFILVLALRSLLEVARDDARSPPADLSLVAAGTFMGGIGIAMTSLVILAWTEINTSWLFWGMAGAVIGVASRRVVDRDPGREPVAG
jgi:O-antigen ligase